MAEKYFVFKVDEESDKGIGELVHDAVVIRDQDMFSPQVYWGYATAAQNAIEILERVINKVLGAESGDLVEMIEKEIEDLTVSADFFRTRAEQAERKIRKLPTP